MLTVTDPPPPSSASQMIVPSVSVVNAPPLVASAQMSDASLIVPAVNESPFANDDVEFDNDSIAPADDVI